MSDDEGFAPPLKEDEELPAFVGDPENNDTEGKIIFQRLQAVTVDLALRTPERDVSKYWSTILPSVTMAYNCSPSEVAKTPQGDLVHVKCNVMGKGDNQVLTKGFFRHMLRPISAIISTPQLASDFIIKGELAELDAETPFSEGLTALVNIYYSSC